MASMDRRPSRKLTSSALTLILLLGCSVDDSSTTRSVTQAPFGTTTGGETVEQFTLVNGHGVEVRAITFGGIITSLRTPDRDGNLDDIVLGFDELDPYLAGSPYFGSIIGRYGNRIAGGRFDLDGATYTLAQNNGPNHLHGGEVGFDKVVWAGEPFENDEGLGVVFTYTSADGEEGYPGTLNVEVTYTLTETDELVVDYRAVTDRATPVNLTQHSYFNLAGRGDILGHELMIAASAYTPVDSTLIPTGELAPVQDTPFDFRTSTPIGARIDADDAQIHNGRWSSRPASSSRVPAAPSRSTPRSRASSSTRATSWTGRSRGRVEPSTSTGADSASRRSITPTHPTNPRSRRPSSGPARNTVRVP
jgi:aldose 1-epimerase